MSKTKIEEFWQAYLDTLPASVEPLTKTYEAWGFGDNPQMADTLGQLVLQGVKTATCSLLWEYEADSEPLPQVGELSLILNGQGDPLCIIETIEVTQQLYNQVDAQFAYEEGEGDRSLAYWRHAHWDFFSNVCDRIGRSVLPTMPLVCERFRVVYPVAD